MIALQLLYTFLILIVFCVLFELCDRNVANVRGFGLAVVTIGCVSWMVIRAVWGF